MLKLANDGVRFVFEQATLLLIVWSGFRGNLASKLIIGILIPIAAIIFWARFMAPASPNRLTESRRIIAECVLFGGTGVLVAQKFSSKLAIIYLIMITINIVLDHALNA
ncbi:YrdB family protein [Furfurilactobacillus milii]|uniref:DUF2568 domain-containing protein n=1 Tax=Furfurilactobacillus milii TaxID=2888272 RepID=A0A6N9I4F5_9LACO|nr:YrdB family protein [Furfurilactobacillus milii]MYV17850.1 DUF2568 domain-containing protein [Furfurilactobacillus milii]